MEDRTTRGGVITEGNFEELTGLMVIDVFASIDGACPQVANCKC